MSYGVLLAFLAYGLFSSADALIKSTGGALGVFEVGFFTSLFGSFPAILSKARNERWRDLMTFNNPRLLNLRGISGVAGSACVIFAFTHAPMAEVYSLAFLAPIFVVLLSVVFLHETVPRRRWPLLVASFLAVILIIRPGFDTLAVGHLAALACALFSASNTILLRRLAPTEHRLGIFAVVTSYSVSLNGIAMLVLGFEMPELDQLGILFAIGTLGGLGHLTFINASKLLPANQIAPAQYTQMVWALAFGAIFYGEFADLPAILGIAVLCLAGLAQMLPAALMRPAQVASD